jgi:hypothetical protein
MAQNGYLVPFDSTLGWFTPQSTSDYTVIAFKDLPDNTTSFDFRVQAQIGYFDQYYMPFVAYSFTGQVSGWSDTQTIDVPAISQSNPTPITPTPTTSASPTATTNALGGEQTPQDTWVLYGTIAVLGTVVALLVVAVAVLSRKIKGLERKSAV